MIAFSFNLPGLVTFQSHKISIKVMEDMLTADSSRFGVQMLSLIHR